VNTVIGSSSLWQLRAVLSLSTARSFRGGMPKAEQKACFHDAIQLGHACSAAIPVGKRGEKKDKREECWR
jgi:hypothetical protein